MSATVHPLERIDTQTPRFFAGLSTRIHAPLENTHHTVIFKKETNLFKISSANDLISLTDGFVLIVDNLKKKEQSKKGKFSFPARQGQFNSKSAPRLEPVLKTTF